MIDVARGIRGQPLRCPHYRHETLQREQRDLRSVQRHGDPFADRLSQHEPSFLDQLGDLPARDDAHAQTIRLVLAEQFAMSRTKMLRVADHPNPNVGVEQNHWFASHSSAGTAGSNGSS